MKTCYSKLVLFFFLTYPIAHCGAEPQRNWKDISGNFSVDGKFRGVITAETNTANSSSSAVSIDVKIEKAGGKVIKVPLNKLSQSDQDYVENKIAAEAAQNRIIKIDVNDGSISINGAPLPDKPTKLDLIRLIGKPRTVHSLSAFGAAARGPRLRGTWGELMGNHKYTYLVWDKYGIYARLNISPTQKNIVWKMGVHLKKHKKTNETHAYYPKKSYPGEFVIAGADVTGEVTDESLTNAGFRPGNVEKAYWKKSFPDITLTATGTNPFKPAATKRVVFTFK